MTARKEESKRKDTLKERKLKNQEINNLLKEAINLALNISTINIAIELLNIARFRIAIYGLPLIQFTQTIDNVKATIQTTIANGSNIFNEQAQDQTSSHMINWLKLQKKIKKINKEQEEIDYLLYRDKNHKKRITTLYNKVLGDEDLSEEEIYEIKIHIEHRKQHTQRIDKLYNEKKEIVNELDNISINGHLPLYIKKIRNDFIADIRENEKIYKIINELSDSLISELTLSQDFSKNSDKFTDKIKDSKSTYTKTLKHFDKYSLANNESNINKGRY